MDIFESFLRLSQECRMLSFKLSDITNNNILSSMKSLDKCLQKATQVQKSYLVDVYSSEIVRILKTLKPFMSLVQNSICERSLI